MKKPILTIMTFILLAFNAVAETLYVKDIEEITLRTEPQIGRNVIDMISSGMQLKVLKRNDSGWAEVLLPDGRRGWVISRFLSSETPNKHKLEQLEIQYQQLADEFGKIKAANEVLAVENKALKTELENRSQQYKETTSGHEQLRQDCADFLELQTDHKLLINEYQKLKHKAETEKIEFVELFGNLGLIFYLSGAGVLLLGMLIGMWIRSKQKRSLYL